MSVRKTTISNCEKKFLLKNLSEGNRLDGRTFNEFRKVNLEFGKDWGCCYVSLGKTKVLAQVSCEIQQPKSSRPSEGILIINIELNPLADPNFEAGRSSDLSVQLNRLLEKCLKDSKAVDLESLCIKMNEKVWVIRVDINVLNHEGNILDCASIAALAALTHFRRPDVTCDGEEFTIHSLKQRDPIPTVIHHYPVCVTYSIFSGGEFILADPTLLEEGVSDGFLSIGLNAYKELCGLHLIGKAALNLDVIMSTAEKAAGRASNIVQQIKESVQADNEKRLEKKDTGFHKTVLEEIEKPLEDLSLYLNQWSSNKGKKKKKKNKDKRKEKEYIEETKDSIAEIEVLGSGTAALVPNDSESNSKWEACQSEDEDEVMVVEIPAPVVETVDIANTDSEEEAVVILNADSKTKKKKKKLKNKTSPK
ncbi:exosome complex component Rrp45 [Leptinotarsa decemlineata]|uniref:exosome complex component Rrp45 n=1 Tax=Leptinotarsa decemlineata TaxID=7539 RepID=UPI003D30D36A